MHEALSEVPFRQGRFPLTAECDSDSVYPATSLTGNWKSPTTLICNHVRQRVEVSVSPVKLPNRLFDGAPSPSGLSEPTCKLASHLDLFDGENDYMRVTNDKDVAELISPLSSPGVRIAPQRKERLLAQAKDEFLRSVHTRMVNEEPRTTQEAASPRAAPARRRRGASRAPRPGAPAPRARTCGTCRTCRGPRRPSPCRARAGGR